MCALNEIAAPGGLDLLDLGSYRCCAAGWHAVICSMQLSCLLLPRLRWPLPCLCPRQVDRTLGGPEDEAGPPPPPA